MILYKKNEDKIIRNEAKLLNYLSTSLCFLSGLQELIIAAKCYIGFYGNVLRKKINYGGLNLLNTIQINFRNYDSKTNLSMEMSM